MKSPFLDKEKIIENQLSFSIYDGFPVSKGHALILPKRIVADIFDLNDDEYNSCFELVKKVRTILLKKFQPDGFNIGVNSGQTAGQTIFHAHIHLIPRYKNDVSNGVVYEWHDNGNIQKEGYALELIANRLRGETARFDIKAGRKVIVEEGTRITPRHIRELEKAGLTELSVPTEYVEGHVLAHDAMDAETGEIVIPCNTAHYWYDDLKKKIKIPILSMPEQAYLFTKKNCKPESKIGLLSTEATIKTKIYNKYFNNNFYLVHPTKVVQKKYVNLAIKLVKQGKVKEASKAIQPAITYFKRIKCNKIILGCTELPVAVFAFKSYKFAKESKIFIDPNLILAEVCKSKYNSI